MSGQLYYHRWDVVKNIIDSVRINLTEFQRTAEMGNKDKNWASKCKNEELQTKESCPSESSRKELRVMIKLTQRL